MDFLTSMESPTIHTPSSSASNSDYISDYTFTNPPEVAWAKDYVGDLRTGLKALDVGFAHELVRYARLMDG